MCESFKSRNIQHQHCQKNARYMRDVHQITLVGLSATIFDYTKNCRTAISRVIVDRFRFGHLRASCATVDARSMRGCSFRSLCESAASVVGRYPSCDARSIRGCSFRSRYASRRPPSWDGIHRASRAIVDRFRFGHLREFLCYLSSATPA